MNPEPDARRNNRRDFGLFYWRSKWMESNRAKANGRSLCATAVEIPVHFHYGNCVLHISLDDLRALGLALQSVADSVERLDAEVKKGSVH
jgi:hypothetical protein